MSLLQMQAAVRMYAYVHMEVPMCSICASEYSCVFIYTDNKGGEEDKEEYVEYYRLF